MDRGAREFGFTNTVSAAVSGGGTIGAGNPVNLLGVWVPGALTAQVVQFWTQTAGLAAGQSTGGQLVIATSTLAANAFYRIPGYFPKGLTYYVTNDNPNLTLFWLPAT